MGLSNREYVGRTMEALATDLGSYIASGLAGAAPGITWPKLLEHKDASAARRGRSASDVDG